MVGQEQVSFDKLDNKLKKAQVDVEARSLIEKNLPFDVLCWTLSELQLTIEKGYHNYTDHDVSIMEEKIFNAELEYDEICWLISYLIVFLRMQHLYP